MPFSRLQVGAMLVAILTLPCRAITFQTLYTFPEDTSLGQYPEGTLTVGQDGNFYGTTTQGGTQNAGTAFRIASDGTFTSLASFDPATTGKLPRARLLNIGDGFLYGSAELKNAAGGTVFRLNPAGGVETLHSFPSLGTPRLPVCVVSPDPNALLVLCGSPAGLLRLPLTAGSPTYPATFNAMGDVGLNPTRFIRGKDGRFYGTTNGTGNSGGSPYEGTIFRVDADGSNFTTLYNFDYATTGARPEAAMAIDADGVLYGATPAGGDVANGITDGSIFRFDPAAFDPGSPGSGFTVLKRFNGTPTSRGDLLLASDNKIYGTSAAYNKGFIWRINRDGSGFQTIVTFNGNNGYAPFGGLVQGTDGALYGTTRTGLGAKVNGTVFRIDLDLPEPPINHRPIAVVDRTTAVNNVPKDIDVLANDYDADQDPRTLEISIIQNPTGGTAVVQDGKIRYSPTTLVNFDELRYKVKDAGGLESTAYVFISVSPLPPSQWQVGGYAGLFYLDPQANGSTDTPRAHLSMKVTAKRTFTGTFTSNGARIPLRGVIADNNLAIARIKIPKQGTAWFLAAEGQGNVMSAYVFGKETWSGLAAPVLPSSTNLTTSHTMVSESVEPGLPVGNGYGVAKIRPTGAISIVGKAGDGSPFKCSTSRVSWNGDGVIPVYVRPVKNGALGGYLQMAVDNGVDIFSGALRWIRPANDARNALYPLGFTGTANTYLHPFTPPPRGSLAISLGGDNIGLAEFEGPQFANVVGGIFSKVGSRLVCSAQLTSLSISPSNGLFSGKFKTPEGKSVSFKGAVIQAKNYGFGHYLLNLVTGTATIANEP